MNALLPITYSSYPIRRSQYCVGEDTKILSCEDAFFIHEYAIPAIQWVCGAGVMQGSGAKLNPLGSATRAQAAAMLMRFAENVAK